ncbi:Eco57I restriction-modification methylase domain-containing protein [Geminocystis sp.]|uniref:type IIG restriction enzyme/methyltransferase n=1 Tax=Geminocystis sp. TaxID=2664100 RepID=UPI003592EC0B
MTYQTILKSLNPAYLKLKIWRSHINIFEEKLSNLLSQTEAKINESEEYHKNNLREFLNDVYYKNNHYINTQDRKDLAIYHGKNSDSKIGIIIETKSPSNKNEMLSFNKFNIKALQQLLYYYLQERIVNKNFELKQLIVTNIYDWFIFPASLFERLFYQDKTLVKQFNDFREKKLTSQKTDLFYQEIAQVFIAKVENELKKEVVYFNLNNYQKKEELDLVLLYKILSPQHLLNLSFANDSNSLDQGFYNELLHIIGLTEVKEKGKKLIQRLPENQRFQGSLLENTITQLDTYNKLDNINNLRDYGEDKSTQLFHIALELVITWINRILFLKLLEAQLVNYNQQDKNFSFLNSDRLKSYNDLDLLFFQVLAKRNEERNPDIEAKFYHVPYLNSSLFEVTTLENQTIAIGSLNLGYELPLFSQTVLKDYQGKRKKGQLNTLHYLFDFLSAFDFSSETSEAIQEENKTLINASVLGLIFEKINGYQDGSFFTPGFITMYMCRETIHRVVIHKFNEVKGWNCQNIDELADKIEDIKEANLIINNIKICDPAVGSGHFLVSALNEIIALKSYLNILVDKKGKKIKKIDYTIKVVNDELIVTDEDGKIFSYNPKNSESQRIQEALFHEKQTIIENCLFGVDININSVKICRLRLWIELLKNAYYKFSKLASKSPTLGTFINSNSPPELEAGGQINAPKSPTLGTFIDSNSPPELGARGRFYPSELEAGGRFYPPELEGKGRQLETLPNIDINIKCGNSLISRFDLQELILSPKIKQQITDFKQAVKIYRNPKSKEEKKEATKKIEEIKSSFSTVITANDDDDKKLRNLQIELDSLLSQTSLFEETTKEKKAKEKKQKQLEKEINLLTTKIDDKKNNRIYHHGFEWRFEFPEVLNDEGNFIGFDVVIGNPPWGIILNDDAKNLLSNKYSNIISSKTKDTYLYFYMLSELIIIKQGFIALILPNTWTLINNTDKFRNHLLNNKVIEIIDFGDGVFQEATVESCCLILQLINNNDSPVFTTKYIKGKINSQALINKDIWKKDNLSRILIGIDNETIKLISKLECQGKIFEKDCQIIWGIKPYQKGYGIPKQTQEMITKRIYHSNTKIDSSWKPLLVGSNIHRYFINYQNIQYIKYGNNLMYPSSQIKMDNPKILMRQTSDKIICAYDKNKFYCQNSVFIITSENINLKFLMSLLNSKLLNFYYSFKNPQKGKVFAEIKPSIIKELPIKSDSLLKENIISLATQILDLKEENPNNDTSKLEREIDLLVYELYDLTEEEIKLIEG